MDKIYIGKEELAGMLGSLKSNKKTKPILIAFAFIWIAISMLLAALAAIIIVILGILTLIVYVPFLLVDVLLDKLFNKG